MYYIISIWNGSRKVFWKILYSITYFVVVTYQFWPSWRSILYRLAKLFNARVCFSFTATVIVAVRNFIHFFHFEISYVLLKSLRVNLLPVRGKTCHCFDVTKFLIVLFWRISPTPATLLAECTRLRVESALW